MEKKNKAFLYLEDGSCFEGISFGAEKSVSGECVFQTGMVGYPESLTDPSYKGQILVFTFPLIGNYGIPSNKRDNYDIPLYFESSMIHISGLIVADYTDISNHWNSIKTLSEWLKEEKIPAIYGLDTRAIVKKIRDKGSMLAKIIINNQDIPFEDPNKRNLVDEVSTKKIQIYGNGDKTILFIDCGNKYNQIRCFLKRGVTIKIVPWNYDISKESNYDGIFISNGPGDPNLCQYTIQQIKNLLQKNIPIFGICLGHQLLGLAAGGKTYKMKFGNRGHNQPCIDLKTGRCHLTMQNHGYALDEKTLPNDWEPFFINANDGTNEGIIHKTKPFFSVQFHPEAKGGPTETEYLFDKFLSLVRNVPFSHPLLLPSTILPKPIIHKVLILGSGGLSIGQAGEFDYSGSQAIKALKEEGIQTILINPNIATVQTTQGLADKVYFLPVKPEFVIRIIEIEKPDGILITFGGQTALNCGIELYKQKIFEKMNVNVLGTAIEAIIETEDRELFAKKMEEIHEKIAPSYAASNISEALKAAEKIGYPVILRSAYALGGLGSGFANNSKELTDLTSKALKISEQVLIEKSMKGWKEIEYEVVRDCKDNCITITNMENFDPLGIHTGESIVVAPSQTLSDHEYHLLRSVAIKVIRHIGIIGECNIQFALNPNSDEYCIIEVNARLSRSSALASKATGYPLAFIAAKLSLGIDLPSLKNSVTKVTTACFEPSLDYITVKIPIWDLKKFEKVDTKLGSSMKSVGEVMAIGKTFEEAIQKAIRMIKPNCNGFQYGLVAASEEELEYPSDKRIFVIASAMKDGWSIDKIHNLTKIDKWFLYKLKNISDLENQLQNLSISTLTPDFLLNLKKAGFSDKQIAINIGSTELAIRDLRIQHHIIPYIKQIDTVAAEVIAQNNYLYCTYHGCEHDIEFKDRGIIVIGSGGYRIGSSVEFDWCAVSAITSLKKMNKKSIMINFNPETVSTDYDICDKLYFEELTMERILDIYQVENSIGIIISMGGQIPNNLAIPLLRQKVNILGTSPEMIDNAENRYKFSRLLDSLNVDQPQWKELITVEDIKKFCLEVGYPVLVRPSYVLSGACMNVVHTEKELQTFLTEATEISKEHPVVVSKFIEYAKEIEMDAIAKDGHLIMHCISEHVEHAGVHSGDATLIFPPKGLSQETIEKIEIATKKIAKALLVTGPFNIQFLAKDDQIKVIECNLRASRSFPFVSKTLKYNLIEMATRVILNEPIKPYPITISDLKYVGVKVSQFSFSRLRGADPILRVEMSSTGEVACFGMTKFEAFLKAYLSTGLKIPKKNIFLSIGSYKEKMEFLSYAKKLVETGYSLFGSSGTADFISSHDIPITVLDWSNDYLESNEFSIEQYLTASNIDLCIICPSNRNYRRSTSYLSQGYLTRRRALDFNVPLITNLQYAKLLIDSFIYFYNKEITISDYDTISSRRIIKLPGLIDMHVHVREPGYEYKEDWDSCTSAALAGGFTIIGAMPNTNPPITDVESFQLVSKLASNKAKCDYGLYVGASPTNINFINKLALNCVAMKVYLNKTFTNLTLDNFSIWIEHFKHWPKEIPICCHAESEIMASVILLASLFDKSVHICHVSRKDEIEIIREAKKKGIKITCEVTPHHLFLTEDDQVNLKNRYKVCPALNKEIDRIALWENMDIIDCFASDHAPHTLEEKDSDNSPPGFPGLETSLALFLTAVHNGYLTLNDLIDRMYNNPKKIFNLPEQFNTYIEVDLDQNWIIPNFMTYSKSKWTPFSGKHVIGKVIRVVLRGEIVFLNGNILASPGFGKDICENRRIILSSYSKEIPKIESSKEILTKIESSPITSSELISTNQTKLEIITQPFKIPIENNFQGKFYNKSILSVEQFTREDLHILFTVATEMKKIVRTCGSSDLLKGKVLATLFIEPSTRTHLSFISAMQRLGGMVISLNEQYSSMNKGESLEDTIRTLECYADIIVIRHPKVGIAKLASKISHKPIINAGDGIGEHPTQALLDVFTIREELGTVNGLIITLIGDLKNGRTVHSLVKLLSLYKISHIHYISPPNLRMPEEIIQKLDEKGISQTEHLSLETPLPFTDVLYVTRIQEERFTDPNEYLKIKEIYQITPKTLIQSKPKVIMHPLPRVQEISTEVDVEPSAAYFRQMENGIFIRMALLSLLLSPSLPLI